MDQTCEDLCDTCFTNNFKLKTGETFSLKVCFDTTLVDSLGKAKPAEFKRKKQEKNMKREEILKKVAALRNSGGGSLFVHMRKAKIRRMSTFHEFIDTDLNNLIEDGSAFTDEYKKVWFCDDPSDELHHYLVLTVGGSKSLSTANFKTKVSHDDCIVRPTSQNVDRLLSTDSLGQMSSRVQVSLPILRGIGDSVYEEDRHIQFKSCQHGIVAGRSISKLSDYVWTHLRLPEYITAFSKLPKGGSLYVGIAEDGEGGIQKEGIILSIEEHDTFSRAVMKKINSEIATYSLKDKSFQPLSDKAIAIKFYPVHDDKYVIEIAVAPFFGCLFYDPLGPETYFIESKDMTMRRLDFCDWIDKFDKRAHIK